MKVMFKSIGLLIIGLLTAIIIYPMLHELGHSVMALMVGATILEIELFPFPYVLCSMDKADTIGQVMTGIGGLFLPLIISQIKVCSNFWLWYTRLILNGISVLAFIISTISTILFINGNPLPNDDTAQILQLWPNGIWIILLLSVVMGITVSVSIVKEKPLKNCIEFCLNTKQKNKADAN